jgi:electron transport complex protein RnfC
MANSFSQAIPVTPLNSTEREQLSAASQNQPLRYTTSFDFHGGIHPEEQKTISSERPIRTLPLPPKLIVPVKQHVGQAAEVIVTVGEQVLGGQLIAEAQVNVAANVHAPTSGTVIAIEQQPYPQISGLPQLAIVIEPDGEDKQLWYSPIDNPISGNRQTLLERIQQAGIVGMGGASFPSHIKLMPQVKTLIINAAECEPYITCDDRLMREFSHQLIEAFRLITHICQASECIIGIEDNKPQAIAALEQAIKASQLANIRLCVVPTKYPSGGEKQLIELVTGKQVPRGQLPSSLGVVVHNVATAFAIYQAITQGKPLIERLVTVTGQSNHNAGNFWVRIGTPIDWLLSATVVNNCNHNAFDPTRVDQLIMGGPMMGFQVQDWQAPVIKSTNCLIATAIGELTPPTRSLPCIRCGECSKACPASLLPQQLYWFARAENFEKTEEYHLFDCIECGACSYVCPSEIPLVQYYRFAKSEVRRRAEEKQKADIARRRHEFKELRLKREKAERAERHKKAAQSRSQMTDSQEDPRKAAIAEAVARAKAKKQQKEESQTGAVKQSNSTRPDHQQPEN